MGDKSPTSNIDENANPTSHSTPLATPLRNDDSLFKNGSFAQSADDRSFLSPSPPVDQPGGAGATSSKSGHPTQICDTSAISQAAAVVQCSAMTQSSDANSEGNE